MTCLLLRKAFNCFIFWYLEGINQRPWYSLICSCVKFTIQILNTYSIILFIYLPFVFFFFPRLSLKNVRVAVKELESFLVIWMEALLIQSSKRLMVKSADMKNTQNIVLKLSTPGGQLFPKLSLAMLLPEKSVQPSLGAHVKLESMLFYLSTLRICPILQGRCYIMG